MLADDQPVLANDEAIGVGVDLDRTADSAGVDRVAVVGGGLKARLNGAVAADVPEAEGAGGALRQRPARAKSRQDPMGWPRKPVVATITVAEVRLHLSRSAQLCSNLPTQNFWLFCNFSG